MTCLIRPTNRHLSYRGPVVVERPLTAFEADLDEVGPMYRVCPPRGYAFDVFEDELMTRQYHDSNWTPGTVFVFGSNLSGIHGAGAARFAHEHCRALMGVGEGISGEAYALPTKERNVRDSRPLADIAHSARLFIAYAKQRDDVTFFLTRVGCGLAGFTDEQIAPLFAEAPANVLFPPEWRAYGG